MPMEDTLAISYKQLLVVTNLKKMSILWDLDLPGKQGPLNKHKEDYFT